MNLSALIVSVNFYFRTSVFLLGRWCFWELLYSLLLGHFLFFLALYVILGHDIFVENKLCFLGRFLDSLSHGEHLVFYGRRS